MEINLNKIVVGLGVTITLCISPILNAANYGDSRFYWSYKKTYSNGSPFLSQSGRDLFQKNNTFMNACGLVSLIEGNHRLYKPRAHKTLSRLTNHVESMYDNINKVSGVNGTTTARNLQYAAYRESGISSPIKTSGYDDDSLGKESAYNDIKTYLSDGNKAVVYIKGNSHMSPYVKKSQWGNVSRLDVGHAVLVYNIYERGNRRYVSYVDPWTGRIKSTTKERFLDSINLSTGNYSGDFLVFKS